MFTKIYEIAFMNASALDILKLPERTEWRLHSKPRALSWLAPRLPTSKRRVQDSNPFKFDPASRPPIKASPILPATASLFSAADYAHERGRVPDLCSPILVVPCVLCILACLLLLIPLVSDLHLRDS